MARAKRSRQQGNKYTLSVITIPANELDKDQLEALKAILKAFKIKFEVAN